MSQIFNVLHVLNEHKIHFFVQQLRPKSLTIHASLVGCRIEIEIFDDDQIEIARFDGDESIEGGIEVLMRLIDKFN